MDKRVCLDGELKLFFSFCVCFPKVNGSRSFVECVNAYAKILSIRKYLLEITNEKLIDKGLLRKCKTCFGWVERHTRCNI